MDFFRVYEKVSDKICYKLIRIEGNEELLSEIPYEEFLDLAKCFYYVCNDVGLGEGTILIHNTHIAMWGIDVEELSKKADVNTPRLFPKHLVSMNEILKELTKGATIEEACSWEDAPKLPMKVLTNTNRTLGAACILYPGMLDELASEREDGFYIIPSSVHEVILLDRKMVNSIAEVKQMIYEVNRQHVAREEVLSDNLYFYDSVEKKVSIV